MAQSDGNPTLSLVRAQKVTTPFEIELEMFGAEEIQAQQYFFGFLSLQLVPLRNPDVLAKMQETSMFWIATRYSLLMSAFIVLGRIFDQDPKSLHNINKLLDAVTNEIGSLSKAGLEQRRIAQGMGPSDAAAYAAGTYDLTIKDVRAMRKAVAKWRAVYEARYRDIRHKIFAHKGVSRAGADALMAATNINEVKELLGFLQSLYGSLDQLHLNGIAPDITPATFALPPALGSSNAAERMYRESADLLYGMLDLSRQTTR
jgi:AbiU2